MRSRETERFAAVLAAGKEELKTQASYKELLQAAEQQLQQAGVPEARLDAWYLFEECFGVSRSWYFLHQEETAADAERTEHFFALVKRRNERIPLQYILGRQEFMGLSFRVNEQVLIPRQDTETLVELVLKEYSQAEEKKSVLDMCTGSGCILLSLMKLGPFDRGTGADRMPGALAVARRNAQELGIRAVWLQSDMFDAVPEEKYDVIVSNPPYITGEELKTLEPEVRDYEPRVALYAAGDGLYFYRVLAQESPKRLKEGGRIYVEIGCGQGTAVRELFQQAGFAEVEIHKDLAGLDRVVCARWDNEMPLCCGMK